MTASFQVKVQLSARRFTIPIAQCRALDIKDGDSVRLVIRPTPKSRKVLFRGRKTLKSGCEIYGKDIAEVLTSGSIISVQASKPTLRPARQDAPKRRFWIVSPNVMDDETVTAWRQASLSFHAAFMGWDRSHPIGHKFAHVINPGDIILIARSKDRFPDIIGFGVVKGPFTTQLDGFVAPAKKQWHGSIRRLSPFAVPKTELPADLIDVLNHRMSLCELHPERPNKIHHKHICEWLESQLAARIEDDASVKEALIALERKAGFQSNKKIRDAVESHAMGKAKSELEARGYRAFTDTSKYQSYDYTCCKDGKLYYVEVKGTQTKGVAVILTRNEVTHAEENPENSIMVIVRQVNVTNSDPPVATGGKVYVDEKWRLNTDDLTALQYEWKVSKLK